MFLALISLLIVGPGPFTLVNGTGLPLASLSVRPALGSASWQPLGPGRLSPGARGSVPALSAETCAFEIEAVIDGEKVRWNDVNLCDVRTLTLRRRGTTLWVDYD